MFDNLPSESPNALSYRLLSGDAPTTIEAVLAGWRDDADFAVAFSKHIAESGFNHLLWETQAMRRADVNRAYEHVLIDAPGLGGRQPDQDTYAAHLDALPDNETAAQFANLGGDAILIAPAPLDAAKDCIDIAAFCRAAPPDRLAAFWRRVAIATMDRLSDRPVWLNTHGGGVAWLHVRLDDRPKYYEYAPYRRFEA